MRIMAGTSFGSPSSG